MGLDTRIYVVDPKTSETIVDELYYARNNWEFTRAVWGILEAGEEQNGFDYRLIRREICQIEEWIMNQIRSSGFDSDTNDYSSMQSGFYDIDDALSCLKAMLLAERYINEKKIVYFEADY